jgi:RNA polymerase sigma-70 factor (ECF subfamily)
LRQNDAEAWRRFVDLYSPLLLFWVRRLQLQPAHQLDLVQEVFTTLWTELPRFESRPGKRFRGWLWTVTINKHRERERRLAARPAVSGAALPEAETPCPREEIDEAEYRQYHVNRAMQLTQTEFEPATWQACWEFVVNSRLPQLRREQIEVALAFFDGIAAQVGDDTAPRKEGWFRAIGTELSH